jgi:hypothetical protein
MQLAQSSFSAFYLSQLIRLFIHFKFSSRFNGRALQLLEMNEIAYSALGFVVGRVDEASRVARLQLLAYRREFYRDSFSYPIFHFMMRIIADYLQEPPHILQGESIDEPVFNELFSLWCMPNADAIAQTCLAALDLHTDRSIYSSVVDYEFDVSWGHTPIEILLMFKLRELQGLANPKLDHPLMNSPLGVLPRLEAVTHDNLIDDVRTRMQVEGFNEVDIFEECFAS